MSPRIRAPRRRGGLCTACVCWLLGLASGFDASKFKTCAQSGFCRAYRPTGTRHPADSLSFALEPASFLVTAAGVAEGRGSAVPVQAGAARVALDCASESQKRLAHGHRSCTATSRGPELEAVHCATYLIDCDGHRAGQSMQDIGALALEPRLCIRSQRHRACCRRGGRSCFAIHAAGV